MRTGLITFHFAHHYGAQLQALATMKAIQSLGHECQIIDYRLPHTTRTNQIFKKSRSVRDMASDAHTALHYAAFQRRFQRFEDFVAQEMELSPRRYTAFEQLREEPPAYDVYVAGSDQIWNPYIFQDKQFDPAFLLDFVKEGRRIAYAPSLGVPQLPERESAELKRFLEPFSALSVREKRGQVLVKEAADRQAKVVLDPPCCSTATTGVSWRRRPGIRGPTFCAISSPTPVRRPPMPWRCPSGPDGPSSSWRGPDGRSTARRRSSLTRAPGSFWACSSTPPPW